MAEGCDLAERVVRGTLLGEAVDLFGARGGAGMQASSGRAQPWQLY